MSHDANVTATLFSKIVQGQVPAEVLYQDEWVTAFRDRYPNAPVHVLVVPNQIIKNLSEVTQNDEAILGRLLRVVSEQAKVLGLNEKGYRVIINCLEHGGQVIPHLHLHLMGGEPMGPMRCKH